MMHLRLIPLALCSVVAAQGVTSPKGLDTTEGNTTFSHFGGTRRLQQLEAEYVGTPIVVQTLAWRRNGGGSSATSVRTFDLTVEMGRTNFAAISHAMDQNYLPGTRTTVFGPTQVNFPDWSVAAPTPAPFDFSVTLATPYVYTGTDALVIDFSYANNSSTGGLTIDRHFTGPTSPTAGTALSTGCIASTQSAAFGHTAFMSNLDSAPTVENGMRFRFAGTNCPAGPVVLMLDGVNQNLAGVLCTTLHASPVVTITQVVPAGGTMPDLSLGFRHSLGIAGATLYSQLVAIDAAQTPFPVVLSNGRSTTMPVNPFATAVPRSAYIWATLPANTATAFIGGGIVMKLN